ncbi:MAG: glycosyltransferase family 2 protein [Akkermansiaceae bacterium]
MISIIIPSYNRRAGMLALLGDIYQQKSVEFEVIVVDDCSPDDSVEAIRREFPSVKLLVNPVNRGPAGTRNRGILAACGHWIVGFDSDVTLPDRLLLAKIERHSDQSGAAVDGLAFRIFRADGTTEDEGRWWHPVPIADFAGHQFFTSYFSGTAYALKREAITKAGLFPELLYMHYEEVELAWRILDRGGQILYSPDLTVVHHANPVSRRGEVEVFLKPRNQILLAISCLPLVEAFLFIIPRTSFQLLKACAGGHFLEFLMAIRSACSLAPRQMALRKPLRRTTLARMKALKTSAALHPPLRKKNG